jgi:type IV secretion system protein VirB11
LKIWNSGSPGGITTIHADDAASALLSLGSYVQEAGVPPQTQLIARAINLVVFIELQGAVRKVTEILELKGLTADGEFTLTPAA